MKGHPWLQFDPNGLRLVPNTHRKYRARINNRIIKLDINSSGIRGPEIETIPPPHTLRILFLGDSVIFGPGLEYEETVPRRLSRILGPYVQVLNGGVPGLNLEQEVDFLIEKRKELNSDMVVVGFYLNDAVKSIVLKEEYGELDEFSAGVLSDLRAASSLFNYLWKRFNVRRLLKARGMETAWVEPFLSKKWESDSEVYRRIIRTAGDDFGAAWDKDSWEIIDRQLARLVETCEASGRPPAAVVFPVSIQVESDYYDDFPQKKFAQLAREHNIKYLDLLPLLRKHREEKLFFDQCHLTSKGTELAARFIARWLKSEVLMERPRSQTP
ncbi:MAG: GDSL-type esterase/lipase family protein [bacterium]